jgi:hypothetical protein
MRGREISPEEQWMEWGYVEIKSYAGATWQRKAEVEEKKNREDNSIKRELSSPVIGMLLFPI